MSTKTVTVDVGTVRAEGREAGQQQLFVERDILQRIGVYMQGVTSRAFGDQGRPAGTWAPRMTPSVPSIVRQLNRGSNPSAKYFKPAPALIDTTTLSRSISPPVVTGRTVEIGSTAPYATQMQDGGTSTITLTSQGRSTLGDWLRGLSKTRRRAMSGELGWLFNKPSFDVTARPRPFLIVTSADEKEFASIVADEIQAAANE